MNEEFEKWIKDPYSGFIVLYRKDFVKDYKFNSLLDFFGLPNDADKLYIDVSADSQHREKLDKMRGKR